jgi:hypothetical protein
MPKALPPRPHIDWPKKTAKARLDDDLAGVYGTFIASVAKRATTSTQFAWRVRALQRSRSGLPLLRRRLSGFAVDPPRGAHGVGRFYCVAYYALCGPTTWHECVTLEREGDGVWRVAAAAINRAPQRYASYR